MAEDNRHTCIIMTGSEEGTASVGADSTTATTWTLALSYYGPYWVLGSAHTWIHSFTCGPMHLIPGE